MMPPLVAELVAPYIDQDAAFARFVSCTARSLVPHPCHHWERRLAPLIRALAAGTARFAVRMPPLHDFLGAGPPCACPASVYVAGASPGALVGCLREAGDRLDELLHPAYAALDLGGGYPIDQRFITIKTLG
jgi:hypothetical protein